MPTIDETRALALATLEHDRAAPAAAAASNEARADYEAACARTPRSRSDAAARWDRAGAEVAVIVEHHVAAAPALSRALLDILDGTTTLPLDRYPPPTLDGIIAEIREGIAKADAECDRRLALGESLGATTTLEAITMQVFAGARSLIEAIDASKPAPRPASVADALDPSHVVEFYVCPDWWQVKVVRVGSGSAAKAVARWRHNRANDWSTWGQPWEPHIMLALPCRRVAIAEADGDPAIRGQIGGV